MSKEEIINDYFEHRLDNQIKWYSQKSSIAQKNYKIFQIIEIILSALTPVLGCICLAFEKTSIAITIVMSLFGAAIVIIEAICKMYKFHENWIDYRQVSETLKHEKYLYITKTSPYNNEDAFDILVQRVERAISSENINWVGINEKQRELLCFHQIICFLKNIWFAGVLFSTYPCNNPISWCGS